MSYELVTRFFVGLYVVESFLWVIRCREWYMF